MNEYYDHIYFTLERCWIVKEPIDLRAMPCKRVHLDKGQYEYYDSTLDMRTALNLRVSGRFMLASFIDVDEYLDGYTHIHTRWLLLSA